MAQVTDRRSVFAVASDSPAVDQIPAAAALVAYLLLRSTGAHILHFDQAGLTAYYQTLVGVAAGLFGLVFAAVAILRSQQGGRRLNAVRAHHGRSVTANLMAAIRTLGVATLITILAMALDQPGGHRTLARAATVWVLTLGVVRVVRLLWVFSLVLDLSDRDAEEERSAGQVASIRVNPERLQPSRPAEHVSPTRPSSTREAVRPPSH